MTASDPVLEEMRRVGAGITRRRPRGEQVLADVQQQSGFEGPLIRRTIAGVIQSPQYLSAPQLAEVYVERHPEYIGRDVEEVTLELQREMIESMVELVRRRSTTALSRARAQQAQQAQ